MMRAAIRWLPGLVLALAVGATLAALVVAGGPRGLATRLVAPAASAMPGDSVRVVAAVREYYRVTDTARRTGEADLVDAVTATRASPANFNFREFLRESLAADRLTVVTIEHFDAWAVTVNGDTARAEYTEWLTGYDISARTRRAVEAENTTTKGRYVATLRLLPGVGWRIHTKTMVADDVP